MGRSPLPVTTRSQSRLRYQNGCGALRIFSVSWWPIWQIGRRDLEIIDWLLSNQPGEVYLNYVSRLIRARISQVDSRSHTRTASLSQFSAGTNEI
jgi:hypothetical protein